MSAQIKKAATDAPRTLAEMREAAGRAILAQFREEPDGTRERMIHNRAVIACSKAVLALPLPSDAEMEEMLARALFAAEFYERKAGPVFVSPNDERWKAWLPLARAVISAMRGGSDAH